MHRREHLSEEDLKKNKAMMESISKGQIMDGHHTEGVSVPREMCPYNQLKLET